MGFRFYKRVNLFPGVSVNVSRSGPSLTFGVRGAHVTMGRTGVTKTVGLPGTGIYYTSRNGYHSGYHSAHSDEPRPPDAQANADRTAERTLGIVMLVLSALAVLLISAIFGHH